MPRSIDLIVAPLTEEESIDCLSSEIIELIIKRGCAPEINHKAVISVINSIIVSGAKDNESMASLVDHAAGHIYNLLEKPLEEWKKISVKVEDKE